MKDVLDQLELTTAKRMREWVQIGLMAEGDEEK